MLNKYFFIVIIILSSIGLSNAQNKADKTPISNVNLIARYLDNKNAVELRFIPTKKSVLYFGINHGFIIERAEIKGKVTKESDIQYKRLGVVKAFDEKQWSTAIFAANEELKERYDMAKDFYKASKNSQAGGSITNIGSLISEKNASDLEYAFLVLTAIQHEKVAQALGLGYIDKTVEKGKKYVYRVSMDQYTGPYSVIPVPYMVTAKKESQTKRKINILEDDTKLVFSWEENDMITGVIVERKNIKTGKYEKLNKNLKITLQGNSHSNGFEDTNLKNFQEYEYKLYGYNVFGDKVLFGEVKATPRDRTPPKSPIILSAEHVSENAVQIKWEIPEPIDFDLKGFKVLRSESAEKDLSFITTLLSKTARSYTDANFIKQGTNYYVIQAIDQSGNTSVSFSAYVTLVDTLAPSKPLIANAAMDSTGIVTILVKKNTEKDLMGYRLLMANDPTHEFTALQDGFKVHKENRNEIQLTFKDSVSLRSLSKYVYYKVAAVDEHYNQSILSEAYKVRRIDTIAPSSPIIKNVIVHPKEIEIHFVRSQSKDVIKHFIYRKEKLNGKWNVLTRLTDGVLKYTDKSVKKDITYYYSLRAQDDSKLYSKYAITVQGTPYDTGKRPDVSKFSVKKKDKQLILTWEYPQKDSNTYFAIYRSNKKGKLVQYKVTEKLNFTDKIAKDSRQYAVKAFTKDGGQSKLSRVLSFPPL